ncbi:TfoX/Sxy family protein [Pseudomonas lijiangensis]|uniref:TfoX/Sxy family protein n=1 Tax=Pseudomonas lijiangensis TaxID=2995658 RepID=UPI0031BA25AF
MNELAAHIKDIFSPLGPVSLRRMFGGHGIFHAGLMFGLVFDGTVYLKADGQNLPAFEAEGLEQFTYVRQGKRVGLAYYRAPDRLFDEPDEARHWARHAFEAAMRAENRRATRR